MSFKSLFILSCLVALNGCAYFLEKSIQPITVQTVNANNAECILDIDNLKYIVYPPQTINVGNSYAPLKVDCVAPGNRKQSVVIPSRIEASSYYNVANGVIPGAAWDIASEALFAYPDVVVVDFTGVEPYKNGMPAHNLSDVVQPEDYNLEEFRPSVPRLNEDKYKTPVTIQRRERKSSQSAPDFTYITTGIDPSGKGGDEEVIVTPIYAGE